MLECHLHRRLPGEFDIEHRQSNMFDRNIGGNKCSYGEGHENGTDHQEGAGR